MKKPTLYVFAISHYCEKARWALDFFEVDYQPGMSVLRLFGRSILIKIIEHLAGVVDELV